MSKMFYSICELLNLTGGAYSSNLNGDLKGLREIERDIDGYFSRYYAIVENKKKEGYAFPLCPNPIGWMNKPQYVCAMTHLLDEYGFHRDHIISATIVDERKISEKNIAVPAYTIAMEQLILMDNHSVTFPDSELQREIDNAVGGQ